MADKQTYLDPNDLLLDDNACRYGIQKHRLERLKSQIVADSEIHTAIEVEPLPKGHESGKTHRVTVGNYRTLAAQELNAEGAGLMIPARIHSLADPLERIKRQISENNERENLSPMDKATAMARLMDLNTPRIEIRKMFPNTTGKKGLKIEPCSNAYLNILLSFLSFDKDTRAKIHDGRIQFSAAYELAKTKDPAKREAILARVEAARLAAIDTDEADEVKFLAEEKKLADTGAKVEAVKKELEETAKEAQSAADALAEAQAANVAAVKAATDSFVASKAPGLTKEQKEAAVKAHKEALKAVTETEKKVKEVEKDATAAAKEADKLAEKVQTAEQKAQEKRDQLAAARANRKANPPAPGTPEAPVTAAEVRAATDGTVALNAKGMREVIHGLTLPGGSEKVQEIGKAIKSCFDGQLTPGQLFKALQKIVGEAKTGKK